MSDAHEDRLLEIALEEAVGGLPTPDLRAAVHADLRRRRLVRTTRGILALAAALLVGIGIGLSWRGSDEVSDVSEAPVALRLERPLSRVDPQGRRHHDTVLRVGDRVVATDEAVVLDAPFGQLTLVPASSLAVRGADDLAMLQGAATVHTAADGGVLDTPVGPATFAGGTRAEVELLPTGTSTMGKRSPRTEHDGSAQRIVIRVTEGSVSVRAGVSSHRIGPGEILQLWNDGRTRGGAVPTRDAQRRLDALLADALVAEADLDPATAGGRDRRDDAAQAGLFLRASVAEDLGAADHLRERLVRHVATATEGDVLARVLSILAADDDPGARAALRRTITSRPNAVPWTVLLQLAEDGETRADAALRRRVESATTADPAALLAAAHFAFRGDDVGADLLGRALPAPFDASAPHLSLIHI